MKTSGLSPPWTQRNCWFMMAARDRQSNESIQASYTASLYLILPGSAEGSRRRVRVGREKERRGGVEKRSNFF